MADPSFSDKRHRHHPSKKKLEKHRALDEKRAAETAVELGKKAPKKQPNAKVSADFVRR